MESLENESAGLQEVLAADVTSQISHLKEEIRSTFGRHRKTLVSRELWLLDQAESIKEGLLALIMRQRMSLAEVRGRLQECLQFLKFSKDHAHSEGVEHAANAIAQLQKDAQNRGIAQESQIPVVKFLHDQSHLRNVILSYGRLETEYDKDLCPMEQSWDFVSEKGDTECSDDMKPLFVEGRCSGTMNSCFKQGSDIEDMDLTSLVKCHDLPKLHALDDPVVLKKVCQANELCNSITECVCDIPCLPVPGNDKEINTGCVSYDPVTELSSRLGAIYGNGKAMAKINAEGLRPLHKDSEQAALNREDADDLLSQISSTVQNLLSTPVTEDKNTNSHPNKNDFINDLHHKLQSILDGDFTEPIPAEMKESEKLVDADKPFSTPRVGYGSFPWEHCEEKFSGDCCDEVTALHARLAKIYQEETKPPLSKTTQQDVISEPDPVAILSKQLAEILAC